MGYSNNSTSTASTSNIDDSSSSQSSLEQTILSDTDTSSVSSSSRPFPATTTSTALPTTLYKYPIERDNVISVIESIEYEVPDQYGQIHPIETDAMIQNRLRDFDDVLNHTVPVMKKKNFNEARFKCPELLTDSFKLMFLRCECFKVDVRVLR
jgi:hypothetical protein